MDKRRIEILTRHAEVSEKEIERYLVTRSQQLGLLCLKYSNPNMTGYPDRLLVLPDAEVIWVELKSRGRKPTKLQLLRHDVLRCLGHRVEVIDNKPAVDKLINSIVK